MAPIIEPKVEVIGYGPRATISSRRRLKDFIKPSRWFKRPKIEITPDEFVYGAAKITYKDIGALQELMELKEREVDLEGRVRNMLVKVAGAGHASMATTPGFWFFLKGTCSKLVDSMFTPVRFGSFLMPSGRRVSIQTEQIVVPKGIREVGQTPERIYTRTSEENIQTYKKLQDRDIPTQDASKVVQYGHRGGGFMFTPLETLVYFSKLAEEDPYSMPLEGLEIISQLEKAVHKNGMGMTYEARKAAPRTGCVNPNIFHFRKNLAEELLSPSYFQRLIEGPIIVKQSHIQSEERDERIQDYLKERGEAFRSVGGTEKNWRSLLTELDHIVVDFNDSVSITTLALTPWRVWGEVKRHRTLPQTAESIYHAVERAINLSGKGEWEGIVSIPGSVRKDSKALEMWLSAFERSFETYETLGALGVPKRDAVAAIPRGIKLGIIKTLDLYNQTTGYMSLRLCETAEPEMRKITEEERRLIQGSRVLPESTKALVTPKCAYTGFCPETNICPRIERFVGDYNEEMHGELKTAREEDIRKLL
jgi:thymidylate synthase ThyX